LTAEPAPTATLAPDPASLPYPGDELVHRVTNGTDQDLFFASGRMSRDDIEAMMAVAGRTLGSYPRILDFGTGCGRVLLWLADVARTSELHGVDIDERAVRWDTENIPYATFAVSPPLPPLDFPDESFDLVMTQSVFTHVDEEYQDRWLSELRRVTRRGGHVLASVHGEQAFLTWEANLAAAGIDVTGVRRDLQSRGIAFLHDDSFVGGPFPDFYHSTFHAPWNLFEHWGAHMPVVAYAPKRSLAFQDLVLMQRPLDDEPLQPVRVEPPGTGGVAAGAGRQGPVGPAPALARAEALVDRAPDPATRTRWGPVAGPARRLVLRALRHHDDHQRSVVCGVLDAVREVHRTVDEKVAPGGLGIEARHGRLAEALRLQGERVNRLEADLWAAIRERDRPVG